MTRSTKAIWGVISILPLLTLVGLAIWIFSMIGPFIRDAISGTEIEAESWITGFVGFWTLTLVLSVVISTIWVVFLVFAIKDQSNNSEGRMLWVLLLIFASVIALPVFWYTRMWTNPDFTLKEHITDRSN